MHGSLFVATRFDPPPSRVDGEDVPIGMVPAVERARSTSPASDS
jgi:hypothetical protein